MKPLKRFILILFTLIFCIVLYIFFYSNNRSDLSFVEEQIFDSTSNDMLTLRQFSIKVAELIKSDDYLEVLSYTLNERIPKSVKFTIYNDYSINMVEYINSLYLRTDDSYLIDFEEIEYLSYMTGKIIEVDSTKKEILVEDYENEKNVIWFRIDEDSKIFNKDSTPVSFNELMMGLIVEIYVRGNVVYMGPLKSDVVLIK